MARDEARERAIPTEDVQFILNKQSSSGGKAVSVLKSIVSHAAPWDPFTLFSRAANSSLAHWTREHISRPLCVLVAHDPHFEELLPCHSTFIQGRSHAPCRNPYSQEDTLLVCKICCRSTSETCALQVGVTVATIFGRSLATEHRLLLVCEVWDRLQFQLGLRSFTV